MPKDGFASYHPAVKFTYFALVLVFSMFLMHPLSIAISLCGAISYLCMAEGIRALRRLTWLIPMLIATSLINVFFNHEGMSVLFYLPSGNPITLESLAYGAAAAGMLISVLIWFASINRVLTSDQFVYLFGRAAPALSLLLSMTLRFVPRFLRQFRTVWDVQKNLTGKGKLKTALTVFSGVLTWSLENAIDTADSMKSRGYGLPGRTAYALYRVEERDILVFLWLGFCGLTLLSGLAANGFYFRYFPTVKGTVSPVFQIVYFALCITPCVLGRKWK